jgi:hypothetical protein
MDVVALVAMYSLTNCFNNVFDPEKHFPAGRFALLHELLLLAQILPVTCESAPGRRLGWVLFKGDAADKQVARMIGRIV